MRMKQLSVVPTDGIAGRKKEEETGHHGNKKWM